MQQVAYTISTRIQEHTHTDADTVPHTDTVTHTHSDNGKSLWAVEASV